MRNDYKPWKKVKRVGKQFGGALAAGIRPLAAGVRPLARGLGYKHGSKKPAKKA